eukprot:TRINITY_DN88567_c0_g1_i1.p1 TRINITY_DN88567_c0_g1~~TRINITY_DN88567_c0_g1_i1.p1  ORF type:complete len:414 (+),score=65.14 TRINITY_DN88567_c0_g1_i1:109-1350(+)
MGCSSSSDPGQPLPVAHFLVKEAESVDVAPVAQSGDVSSADGPKLSADALSRREPPTSTPDMLPAVRCDPSASDSALAGQFINGVSLPGYDHFAEEEPEWKWEKEASEWRSYPLHDCIELERYWKAFRSAGDGSANLAKLSLLKNEVIVDLARMTTRVGDGRPRRIQRSVKAADWLNNAFFVDAFKDALGKAGIDMDSSAEDMFDFRYVQDFRAVRDDGRKSSRGGQEYSLPFGWKRFAVNVRGAYDGGDNSWLREDENGWAVAYHGTSKEGLPGILSSGFRVGARQKFADAVGSGVYCTPTIQVAQHYSKPSLLRGHSVQIVLQLRVKPEFIRPVTDPKVTDFERKYWVINDPAHIRAYGVLIRELPLAEWIPPEIMVYGRDHPGLKQMLDDLAEEIRQQQHVLRQAFCIEG